MQIRGEANTIIKLIHSYEINLIVVCDTEKWGLANLEMETYINSL